MKYKKPTDDTIIASIFVIAIVFIIFCLSVYNEKFKRSDIDKRKYIPKDTTVIHQTKPFYCIMIDV